MRGFGRKDRETEKIIECEELREGNDKVELGLMLCWWRGSSGWGGRVTVEVRVCIIEVCCN